MILKRTDRRLGSVAIVAIVGLLLGAGIVWSPAVTLVALLLPVFVLATLRPETTALVLLPLTPLYNVVVVRIGGVTDLRILELVWLTVAVGIIGKLLSRRAIRVGRLPRWITLVAALWLGAQMVAATTGSLGIISWIEVLQSSYLLVIGLVGAAIVAGASERQLRGVQYGIAVIFLGACVWSLLQMAVPAASFPQVLISVPGGVTVSQALTKTQLAGGIVTLRRFGLLNLGPVASAAFMVWLLGGALGVFLASHSRGSRNFALLTSVAAGLGIVATFSRAGWLAAIAVVLLVVGSASVGRAFWGVVLVSALLVGVSYTPWVSARASELTDVSEGSFAIHLEMWRTTLDMFRSRPLTGWGPGAFRYSAVSHGYLGPMSDPHNYLLQEAAESGAVGALSVLLLSVGVGLLSVLRARTSGLKSLGFAVGLLAVFAVCMTQNGFRTELTWAPYAVTLGLVLRRTCDSFVNESERGKSARWKL